MSTQFAIGIFIRNRRKKLEMSQTVLAQLVDVDQSRISILERGGSPLKAEEIPKLAKALHVPNQEFYNFIE
ncbi:helix-turn-helix domain-containing protein [Periweissella cryptocerci]|nr:helix-turn-helix transcriptional regulator [Periweissella cryptocerci]